MVKNDADFFHFKKVENFWTKSFQIPHCFGLAFF